MVCHGTWTPVSWVKVHDTTHHPTHHPNMDLLASYTTLLFWPGRLHNYTRKFQCITFHMIYDILNEDSLQKILNICEESSQMRGTPYIV